MSREDITREDDQGDKFRKLQAPANSSVGKASEDESVSPTNSSGSPLADLAFSYQGEASGERGLDRESSHDIKRGSKPKFVEAIKTVLISPTPWSSTSNVLFSVGVSYAGIVGHIVSGIWSLRNEVVAKFRSQETIDTSIDQAEKQASQNLSTYQGLLKHLMLSPGASRIFQTGVLLVSALEAPFHGRISEATAFSAWLIGVTAAAFEMNKGYGGAQFGELGIVKELKRAWKALPDWAHRILTSPGISFCSGDLIYSLASLKTTPMLSSFSSDPVSIATGLGILTSMTGIIVGVSTALRKNESSLEKSLPLYCAGIDCGLYGVAQLLSNNIAIGIGFELGFVSNLFFGLRAWISRGKGRL